MSRSLPFLLLVVLFAACMSLSGCAPTVMNTTEMIQQTPTKTPASSSAEAQVLEQRSVFLATLSPSASAWADAPQPARCAEQRAATPLLASPLFKQKGQTTLLSICFAGQPEAYAAFHIYLDSGEAGAAYYVNGMNAQWMIENDSLFRYSGDGRSWSWEFVAPVLSFDAWQNEAVWEVVFPFTPRKAVFEVTDRKWNRLFTTAPLTLGSSISE